MYAHLSVPNGQDFAALNIASPFPFILALDICNGSIPCSLAPAS